MRRPFGRPWSGWGCGDLGPSAGSPAPTPSMREKKAPRPADRPLRAQPGLGGGFRGRDVGGLTTPDSFTLDRATLAVRERQTGRQEVETVLAEHGTTERPLDLERAAQPTLTDAQLARLAEIGINVEHHFGSPQDTQLPGAAAPGSKSASKRAI